MMKQSKPRSRILSLILAGALAVSLLPFSVATAFADSAPAQDSGKETRTLFFKGDGKLYVGEVSTDGKTVEKDWKEYQEQTDKWSVSGDTLTLKGLTFETSSKQALWITDDAKLVLEKGSVNGLRSNSNGLAIQGLGETAELINVDISGGGMLGATGTQYGIFMIANVTVTDVTLETEGALYGIRGRLAGDETSGCSLIVTDSTLRVLSTGGASRGIYLDGITGGTVEFVNSAVSMKGEITAIRVAGGLKIDSSSTAWGTANGKEPTKDDVVTTSADGKQIVIGSDPAGKTFASWVVITPSAPPANTPSSSGSGKSSWTPSTSANVIDVPQGTLGLGTYNNYDKLLVAGLEKLVAQSSGKTVNMDRVENGKVLYRIKIDPAKLAGVLKSDLSLNVHYQQNDAAVLEVANRFAKYYSNNIVAVTYDQTKPLGVNAEFAARLDLSKLNTKTLYFYCYDNTTNTFKRIAAPNYFVDVNGYSHITAPLGGSIIITDKPLAGSAR